MVELAVWIVATVIVAIAVVYGLFLVVGIVSPIRRCRCIRDRASLAQGGHRARLAAPRR
jgi:hypothetical protein